MRPLLLELSNVGSYQRPTTIDLRDIGIVCITGANGAGKSTIAEGIQIALYGRPGRTRSMDDVMSHGADVMRVVLEFAHNGREWRVVRERIRKKRTNATLELLGEDGGEVARGVEAVDAALSELIGVSREAFLTTTLLAQGDASRFCEADPAKRKELFGELLGLDRFVILAEASKTRRREAETAAEAAFLRGEELEKEMASRQNDLAEVKRVGEELEKSRLLLEEARSNLEHCQFEANSLSRLEDELKRVEAEATERISRARTRIGESKKRLSTAEQAVVTNKRSVDVAKALVARIEIAQKSLAHLETAVERAEEEREKREAELADVLEAGRKARYTMDYCESERQRVSKVLEEVKKRLQVIADHGGTTECYVCGQPVNGVERDRLIARLTHERDEALASIALLDKRYHNANTSRNTLKTEHAHLKDLLAKANKSSADARAALVEAESMSRGLESAESQLRDASEALQKAIIERDEAKEAVSIAERELKQASLPDPRKQALTAEIEKTRVAASHLIEAKKRYDHIESMVTQLTIRMGALEERLHRYEQIQQKLDTIRTEEKEKRGEANRFAVLERAFGRDGVPLLIIEGALAELEMDIADVLARLATSGLHVKMVTEKTNASGSRSEALDIIVEADGEERPFELLSGGEKLRLSLAISAALARLMARRIGDGMDMLYFDEPSALDADGVRALVDWLWAMHEEISCIMVVTHLDEIASAFDTKFVVEKSDDSSYLRLVC